MTAYRSTTAYHSTSTYHSTIAYHTTWKQQCYLWKCAGKKLWKEKSLLLPPSRNITENLKNELLKVKNMKTYMVHKTHLIIYRSYQGKKLNRSFLARFLIFGRRFEITRSEKWPNKRDSVILREGGSMKKYISNTHALSWTKSNG